MSDKERVDRLDDAIIEEILGMSGAEAAALVGDADVAASRKSLAQAKGMVGKLRLARAKADVALDAAGAAAIRPRTLIGMRGYLRLWLGLSFIYPASRAQGLIS